MRPQGNDCGLEALVPGVLQAAQRIETDVPEGLFKDEQMPIFEYRCKKCGAEFEALVLGREKPECEGCGAKVLEKKISTFSAGASAQSLPECRGSAPSCQRSVCDSGMCPAMRQ